SRLQRDVDVTTIYVTHDQVEAMTMGDRVAVLKLGVLQQVDAPSRLYRRPTNLFVAGFIGSPAMNLVEATIEQEDDRIYVAFGGNRLLVDPSLLEARPALRSYVDRPVILGIRPEDMEDAQIERGAPEEARLRTSVELREDMGSEVFVHFTVDCPPVLTEDTKELAADRGLDVEELSSGAVERTTFVARFDASTSANEDDTIEAVVDTKALYFFDRETGMSIYDEVPAARAAAPAPA
ncbi:MAG TPA: ABC transporter ATP-binding protein, partial [Actinomycetota bacterium]|nr:ABC transporter ATP-binding protein [Actinomycetota bacterium]